MLAYSELGDRQLPDQCSGAPGQIQWSVTKCDVSARATVPVPWQRGHAGPKGTAVVHGSISYPRTKLVNGDH